MTKKNFEELLAIASGKPTEEKSGDQKTFSQVYERPVEPQDDNPIVRHRIAEYINSNYTDDRFLLSSRVTRELGVKPNTWANKGNYIGICWDEFIGGLKIGQFLSLITVVYRFYSTAPYTTLDKRKQTDQRAKSWLAFCRRVFEEEHLGYVINDFAAVRYTVDQQFETSRQASIALLADSRFSDAKLHLENAYESFLSVPSRKRRAVREMFESIESVFKTLLEVRSLNARAVTSKLGPVFAEKVATNDTERESAKKMMKSFSEWVDAAHFYRHAQKQTDGSEPSHDYGIHLLDSGSSYLRWLISIDRALNQSGDVGPDQA